MNKQNSQRKEASEKKKKEQEEEEEQEQAIWQDLHPELIDWMTLPWSSIMTPRSDCG